MGLLNKIINKHTLSLASNAVMPVIGMVTVGLLARNLSEPDFGKWILFLITFTLANLVRSGFLQTSLVKFYSGASEERAQTVAGSTWVLGFGVTTLLGFISLMAYFFYHGNPSAEITIKWFGIIFFSTLPSSVALWILQAEERFDRMFILQLVGQGCFLVSVIIIIFLKKADFATVIHGYLIAAATTSLFSLVSGWAMVISIKDKTWQCVKELANFGKYSVGTSISANLLRSSDTFIIGKMLPDAFVGIYYLPQRLMEVIEIPLRAFIATALPTMSSSMQKDDKRHMTYIMKKYAGILTILLIPVSIVAFIAADLIIQILGGQKFLATDAANVFRIFMCFAILLPIDRFFGITLDILGKPHINLIKVILMLIVNVVGDFIGIYLTHNLYGVAVSSIFTFLAGVIYGYWVLRKHLNFTLTDIFKLGVIEIKALATDLIHKLKKNKSEV